ncbi:MAG: 3'(2'),5'-bisphosphate nucleotidase CysQ, partial [Leptospiraceae bacterium]|nr:3'(2'),5'-bisphosphate nucleotidase CysQ [Leptospiraceae bacterium]
RRALAALQEATAAVLEVYGRDDFGIQYKDEKEPVTRADLAANEVLERALTDLLPEAGWLSEESNRDLTALANKELLWVVDPIDGTREFIDRNGEFAISVGLVRNGRPVWGAVSLPAEPRIVMSGDQGIRCFDMQNPISDWMRPLAGSGPGLPECRICVSRTEWNRGVFDSQKGDLHIVPEGSVARKMALVAAGDFDLTVSLYPKNDWDIAGGMALILAAGGTILRPDTAEAIGLHPPGERRPGPCCGHSDAVMEYHRYFQSRGLRLRQKYGDA